MGDVQEMWVLDWEPVSCGEYVEFCLSLGTHPYVYPNYKMNTCFIKN